DCLTYWTHSGEESVGRYPDGGKRIYRMTRPTIHATNTLTSYSEWLCGIDEDFDEEEYLNSLISPILMGDVNDDGEVDLSDAIMVTYYSLHEIPSNFNEAAADMNGDEEIDLSDAIIIIYKSLGALPSSNAKRPSKTAASTNDYLQLGNDGNHFGMTLSNDAGYVGFQCDIKLPEGVTLTSVNLNDSRAANHTLMFNQLEDNSYRVAAFSAKGDAFFGNLGELLSFTIDGKAHGDVSIENIFFVNTDLEKKLFANLSTIATGIRSTAVDAVTGNAPLYDLLGRRVNSKQPLGKGIYISGNKKTIR
ncbi:MAG: dockerin type I repeat-containing protein, partial [Bacteroidaceae bacterium]|nr:dockerin type I repeat-containing protein [Bacteroidaceae bacterium]